MSMDMLECLKIDPGRRTLGELLQERQWALEEIARLRRQTQGKLRSQPPAAQRDPRLARLSKDTGAAAKPPAPERLLRLREVCGLVAVSRATVYKWMGEGRFPRSIRLGDRAVRWRAADVLAWQARLGG